MPHLIICQQRSKGKNMCPCSDAALGNWRGLAIGGGCSSGELGAREWRTLCVPKGPGHFCGFTMRRGASDCSQCRVPGGGRRLGSTGGVGGWCRQCWAPLSCRDGIVQQTLPSSGRSRNHDLVVSPTPVFWSGAIGFLLGLGRFLYLINALKIKAPEVRSRC